MHEDSRRSDEGQWFHSESEGSSGGGSATKSLIPRLDQGGEEGEEMGCLPLETNNPQEIYFLKVERVQEEEEDSHSASCFQRRARRKKIPQLFSALNSTFITPSSSSSSSTESSTLAQQRYVSRRPCLPSNRRSCTLTLAHLNSVNHGGTAHQLVCLRRSDSET